MKNEIFDTSSVIYIPHKDIDRAKWDKCVDEASNSLIYASSFYLDAMAKHWDGLVMNDYETVMPVTWNRKYGICYLYQPFLCACLGVFGNNITGETVSGFLNKIPGHFRYWDIYLNAKNNFALEKFNSYNRTNYVLGLGHTYSELLNNYRNSYKQLIKKSAESNLRVSRNIDVEEIIKLAAIKMASVSKVKERDWKNFAELYNMLLAKSKAINYSVYLKDELLASGIFLFSNKRAYYILAGNSNKGRALSASHLVINAFIEDHSASDLILDFEGSNISGIAFFFRGFGATPEEYPGIKYNALPAVVRRLKK